MDQICLEHAAPKVIMSDLIACNAIIIHLVEPDIWRLLDTEFEAVLTLQLSIINMIDLGEVLSWYVLGIAMWFGWHGYRLQFLRQLFF